MVAQGLEEILTDFLTGKSLWEAGDEDVHMAVERVLTARIGDLGNKNPYRSIQK
jgi:argininosuccinate lyase